MKINTRRVSRRALPIIAAVALAGTGLFAVGLFGSKETTTPAQPSGVAADRSGASVVADRWVAGAAGLKALFRGPDDAFIRAQTWPGASGLSYVSYERNYKGLPVVGGDAVVVVNARGQVVASSVAQHSTISLTTKPTVSAKTAAKTSQGGFAAVEGTSVPRLSVLTWGATPVLVWETRVNGMARKNPSNLHVFVSATKGTIVDSYDEVRLAEGKSYYHGTVTFDTTGSGSSYSMIDPRRSGLACGGQDGRAYTSTTNVWGTGAGTDLKAACVDAMFIAQRESNMLRNWLGRNGFSGTGGAYPVRVGLNAVNAYWNGSYVTFGHTRDGRRQATSADVVGHELGHSVFQHTPGGAGSGNENGGVNEGSADIFGALTEQYINSPMDPPDFQVGEEVNLDGGGPIRYMYDPSQGGDPNCYSPSISNSEVHSAAGPLNHWFYLIAKGSAGTSTTPASPICAGGPGSVAGIGLIAAGRIYYNALLMKTSTWRYANVRVATLTAAKILYPGNCGPFKIVKSAWDAVSVPATSGEPTC